MSEPSGWTGWWLERGYLLNPCRDHCPHEDEDHAHLKTPDGDDVMLWADGTWSGYDLSQPARLIYPQATASRATRRPRGAAPPPAARRART